MWKYSGIIEYKCVTCGDSDGENADTHYYDPLTRLSDWL